MVFFVMVVDLFGVGGVVLVFVVVFVLFIFIFDLLLVFIVDLLVEDVYFCLLWF